MLQQEEFIDTRSASSPFTKTMLSMMASPECGRNEVFQEKSRGHFVRGKAGK